MSAEPTLEPTHEAAATAPQTLWRQREFMLLWGGLVVSTLGSAASAIVYPLLILALTGSPTAVGIASALRVVPFVVLCLPVGALVDRWDRRRVMLRCEVGRGVAVATVPVAVALGHVEVWHLYAVALVEGVLMVFYNLAEVAALPRVVSARQLPAAMAQNHAGYAGAEIAGPALGTALFQLWRGLPFVADALSYAFSAWTLWRLRSGFEPAPAGERRHLVAEVAQGLRWLWQERLVRHMAVITGIGNFVHAAVPLLLIVMAKHHGASESQIGVVFSLAGLGGLLGAMVGGWVQQRFTFGQVIVGTMLARALLFPLYGLCEGPLSLGAVFGLIMFFGPIYNVTQLSYRVALIPDGLQGRVNAGYRFVAHLLVPVGSVLCGALIERAGQGWALAVFAGSYGLLTLATMADPVVRDAPRQLPGPPRATES